MNSIEVAKKLVDANNDSIEDYRALESDIRERIKDLEKKIENQKKALEILQDLLTREEETLKEVQEDKFEFLIDNLALKAFIADGGGLDMVVD